MEIEVAKKVKPAESAEAVESPSLDSAFPAPTKPTPYVDTSETPKQLADQYRKASEELTKSYRDIVPGATPLTPGQEAKAQEYLDLKINELRAVLAQKPPSEWKEAFKDFLSGTANPYTANGTPFDMNAVRAMSRPAPNLTPWRPAEAQPASPIQWYYDKSSQFSGWLESSVRAQLKKEEPILLAVIDRKVDPSSLFSVPGFRDPISASQASREDSQACKEYVRYHARRLLDDVERKDKRAPARSLNNLEQRIARVEALWDSYFSPALVPGQAPKVINPYLQKENPSPADKEKAAEFRLFLERKVAKEIKLIAPEVYDILVLRKPGVILDAEVAREPQQYLEGNSKQAKEAREYFKRLSTIAGRVLSGSEEDTALDDLQRFMGSVRSPLKSLLQISEYSQGHPSSVQSSLESWITARKELRPQQVSKGSHPGPFSSEILSGLIEGTAAGEITSFYEALPSLLYKGLEQSKEVDGKAIVARVNTDIRRTVRDVLYEHKSPAPIEVLDSEQIEARKDNFEVYKLVSGDNSKLFETLITLEYKRSRNLALSIEENKLAQMLTALEEGIRVDENREIEILPQGEPWALSSPKLLLHLWQSNAGQYEQALRGAEKYIRDRERSEQVLELSEQFTAKRFQERAELEKQIPFLVPRRDPLLEMLERFNPPRNWKQESRAAAESAFDSPELRKAFGLVDRWEGEAPALPQLVRPFSVKEQATPSKEFEKVRKLLVNRSFYLGTAPLDSDRLRIEDLAERYRRYSNLEAAVFTENAGVTQLRPEVAQEGPVRVFKALDQAGADEILASELEAKLVFVSPELISLQEQALDRALVAMRDLVQSLGRDPIGRQSLVYGFMQADKESLEFFFAQDKHPLSAAYKELSSLIKYKPHLAPLLKCDPELAFVQLSLEKMAEQENRIRSLRADITRVEHLREKEPSIAPDAEKQIQALRKQESTAHTRILVSEREVAKILPQLEERLKLKKAEAQAGLGIRYSEGAEQEAGVIETVLSALVARDQAVPREVSLERGNQYRKLMSERNLKDPLETLAFEQLKDPIGAALCNEPLWNGANLTKRGAEFRAYIDALKQDPTTRAEGEGLESFLEERKRTEATTTYPQALTEFMHAHADNLYRIHLAQFHSMTQTGGKLSPAERFRKSSQEFVEALDFYVASIENPYEFNRGKFSASELTENALERREKAFRVWFSAELAPVLKDRHPELYLYLVARRPEYVFGRSELANMNRDSRVGQEYGQAVLQLALNFGSFKTKPEKEALMQEIKRCMRAPTLGLHQMNRNQDTGYFDEEFNLSPRQKLLFSSSDRSVILGAREAEDEQVFYLSVMPLLIEQSHRELYRVDEVLDGNTELRNQLLKEMRSDYRFTDQFGLYKQEVMKYIAGDFSGSLSKGAESRVQEVFTKRQHELTDIRDIALTEVSKMREQFALSLPPRPTKAEEGISEETFIAEEQ